MLLAFLLVTKSKLVVLPVMLPANAPCAKEPPRCSARLVCQENGFKARFTSLSVD